MSTKTTFRAPDERTCCDVADTMAGEAESSAWIGAVVRVIAGLAERRDPSSFHEIKTLASLAACLADDRGNALDCAGSTFTDATGLGGGA